MGKQIQQLQGNNRTEWEIALGDIDNSSSIDKFGYNPSVGSTFETVWDAGGVYAYPSSAVVMTVTSAGGATDENVEITIIGLDANYQEQTSVVTLNASGVATTSESYLRVYRAYVSNGQEITGTTTIANGGITYAQIETEYQQTMMAVYTIPAGKTGYLLSGNISALKDKDITGKMMMRRSGGVFRAAALVLTSGTPYQRSWSVPQSIPEKTDIEIRAKAGATGGVGAGFEIVLVDS